MERTSITDNQKITNDQRVFGTLFQGNSPIEVIKSNPVFDKLAEEDQENFYNYLDKLGLVNDPDFIILSSSHHYYYDIEELKDIKTVINLKQLNYIKQIKEFLHTIYNILPQKSYFIGCFADNQNQNAFLSGPNKSRQDDDQIENGISSRISFLNKMFNIMDSRTNMYMTARTVSLLLEDAGLKVLDMTELNGLTYFCAQNIKPSAG
jgi:hypothetical protein